MRTRRAVRLISLAAASSLVVCGSLSDAASAKSRAIEVIKYFNPIPEKKHNLNESQDRVIKSRKFKSVTIEGAKPVANQEIGLFVIVPPEKTADESLVKSLLARPEIAGISVLIPWRTLEPKEDEFNWQPVDQLLSLCKENNKSLILRVSTAGLDLPSAGGNSDTPDWVFSADVKSMEYKGADGKQHRMPIFWDTNYLANWSNFINEMASRYDKNPHIHSIGITGGGIAGGTTVVPNLSGEKDGYAALSKALTKDHGMNQRQIVQHWKYVADIFPKAFATARLNFDVNPPIAGRQGQDALDEISDYLIYRYGQRVYLTRQNVRSGKRGFDDYRLVLKFHPDTFTGYQLTGAVTAEALQQIAKNAPVDGISYVELPAAILEQSEKDGKVEQALNDLRSKLGYQVVSQKITFNDTLKNNEKLKVSFTFYNLGAASPMRPIRQFDKDVASSYRIQVELRDANGKPVAISYHTPSIPTNQWQAGKAIAWEEELKMPSLKPGKYSVHISLVDSDTKRKLQILNAATTKQPTPEFTIAAG
ncbi:MAG TPA: DUF4832 domain-containing protein, partial [Candidatus Obscuribacterales bacterium]